jgi:hypothetical protein
MPTKIRDLSHSYSKELLEVVEWCLKLDHLERPQSVFALQKALLDRVPTTRKKSLGEKAIDLVRGMKPRGAGLGDAGRPSTISLYTRQSN